MSINSGKNESQEEPTREEHRRERERHRIYIQRRNRELHYQKALLERLERENRKRRLILIALIVPLLAIMTSLSLLMLEDRKFVEKELLQNDLETIILNGGDLDAIKQAFKTQPSESQVKLIFASKSPYYDINIPLSSVLSDLRVEAFRNSKKDTLSSLELIIAEYEEVNPFDKLQVGQKDYFENIRIKTGNEYNKIANDVNSLADELYHKNMLVNEYLGDSKISFWISIIAVALSLLIGSFQIFYARPEAMRRLFLSSIQNFEGDHNNKPRNSSSAKEKKKYFGRSSSSK